MSDPRFCMHTLTLSADGSRVVDHYWYDGDAETIVYPAPPPTEAGQIRFTEWSAIRPSPTPEDRLACEQRAVGYLEAAHQRRIDNIKIVERAEKLLDTVLDDEQRASWKVTRTIDVIAPSGHRYRLGSSSSVAWLGENGDVLGRMCIHPNAFSYDGTTPSRVLTQLLGLTTDEVNYIKTANVYSGYTPTFDKDGKARPFTGTVGPYV